MIILEISEIKKLPDGDVNNVDLINDIIKHYEKTGDKSILLKINPIKRNKRIKDILGL